MLVLNPRLIVDKANWFYRLFNLNYVAYLRYAVERETRDVRYAVKVKSEVRRFASIDAAVEHLENIRTAFTSGVLTMNPEDIPLVNYAEGN